MSERRPSVLTMLAGILTLLAACGKSDPAPSPKPEQDEPETGNTRPPSPVVQISSGAEHVCVVLKDGSVWCWGSDRQQQLGDATSGDKNRPTRVMGLTGAVQVSAGPEHTCALLKDGTARCWGANSYRELGDGTTESARRSRSLA